VRHACPGQPPGDRGDLGPLRCWGDAAAGGAVASRRPRARQREAIRLSISAGDGAWEGAIVGALHQLKRYIAENPKGFGEGEPAFDALHKQFHASLLAACGSPRLIGACARLYDEAYRYRRLMMATFKSPGEFVRSHEILAEAAIERAAERAEALAEAHIASTLALVYPDAVGQGS
jgi:GntR family transcriptional regulator, carbon starvation induced regulator